jgi:hypothetical protein
MCTGLASFRREPDFLALWDSGSVGPILAVSCRAGGYSDRALDYTGTTSRTQPLEVKDGR